MCVALAIAATAVAATAAIVRGVQQSRAAKVSAAIQRGNADIILAQGRLREVQLRRQVRRQIGVQQGYYAASNIDASSGSPLLAMAQSAAAGELDARLIRADAELQAQSTLMQANETQIAGRQALVAGIFGAGTAILQGAASIPTGGGSAGIWKSGQSTMTVNAVART